MNTAEERGNRVQRVFLIVLACNLLVSAAKIAVGLAANLQSVLADGFHSISDGFSNVIGLIGVAAAKRPSDEGHTYGHSRYETLASLAIVALMACLGISILVRGVRSLGRTDFRVPSAGEFAAVAGTLLLNILTAWLEDRAGRRLKSSILRSDARHTLSDIFVTCGVLVSMALITFLGAPAWVDSAVSVAIASGPDRFFAMMNSVTLGSGRSALSASSSVIERSSRMTISASCSIDPDSRKSES